MILKNLIYIYQLEHYNKKRFLLFVYKNTNWFHLNKRGKLNWTLRSILISLFSTAFIISFAIVTYYFIGMLWIPIFLLFCIIFLPLIILFSDILITPLVLFQKNKTIKYAEKIILLNKKRGLITIGITGSFGKTSMKNILVCVLAEKYKIFTFPGNINTNIGIAQYIIKNKQSVETSDVLVSEMGAYKKGEIKNMCKIVKPYYSIITSIGECHLDRFGSLEKIISTKFELANATENKVFLNTCDENIRKHADTEIINNIAIVKVCGHEDVMNIEYLKEFNGISFKYRENIFTTKAIANYVIDFSIISFKIANEFGLSIFEMKNGLQKINFVPHRLEVIKNNQLNRVIIDDSYNGNYAGFLLGLDILSRANGRKVVLTPGIVELGKKRSRVVHEDLAKKYSENADLVLLIKNGNTFYITREFKKMGYTTFKVYNTAKEAHDDLVNILKNGDTIIFQNDTTDNYS